MPYFGPLTGADPNAPKSYTPRGSGGGGQLTPEEEERIKKAAADARASQNLAAGKTPGAAPTANFEMSPQAQAEIRAAQGRESENNDGDVYSNLMAAKAREDAAAVSGQELAKRGGVETAIANAPAGGITGFFDANAKTQTTHFTAGKLEDQTTAGNRAALAGEIDRARAQPMLGMGATTLGPAAMANAATVNTTPQDQFRAQQLGLAGAFQRTIAGTGGPSVAEQQLNRTTDRNMGQALGLALAARGGNQAAALKSAGMQRAAISQDAAGQASLLRAQEIQNAQQGLAGVLAGGRGQDLSLATDQAGLTQQTALANQAAQNQFALQQGQLNQQTQATNLQAALQQEQMKNDIVAKYRAMGVALDDATLARELQQAQFNAGLLAQQSAADRGVAVQSSAQGGQMVGAGLAALGSVLASAASDERAKFDVKPANESKLEEFFSKAGAHEYSYKDPDKPLRGEGRFTSPMAQELEQSEIGKALVREAPDGTKVVDWGKGFGSLAAGLAMVFKKVKKLELGASHA